MKQVRAQIWVSLSSDRGQASRPVILTYSVNPIGSSSLYKVLSIVDARTEEEYEVESTLSLNACIDAEIAKANPAMREFSKRELGIDLRNQPKKKPMKKKIQSTETNDLLEGL